MITIGVIGVVAAITVPVAVNNIKEHKIKNIVKHTVSLIKQANKMAAANYDYSEESFDPETETLKDRKSLCSLFNSGLQVKYIPLTSEDHPKNYINSVFNNYVAYSFPLYLLSFIICINLYLPKFVSGVEIKKLVNFVLIILICMYSTNLYKLRDNTTAYLGTPKGILYTNKSFAYVLILLII